MKRNPTTHRTLSQLTKALAEINSSTRITTGEAALAEESARLAVLRAIESLSNKVAFEEKVIAAFKSKNGNCKEVKL